MTIRRVERSMIAGARSVGGDDEQPVHRATEVFCFAQSSARVTLSGGAQG